VLTAKMVECNWFLDQEIHCVKKASGFPQIRGTSL